eukprot:gb/GECG01005936.1/.p1 GENE.gb/GECG01005936.1/~~gb/GECG01005936.1/.p1  ORF type:complete len:192 (+),score=10.03 gb/GECG01005936.1/:1-576(+)
MSGLAQITWNNFVLASFLVLLLGSPSYETHSTKLFWTGSVATRSIPAATGSTLNADESSGAEDTLATKKKVTNSVVSLQVGCSWSVDYREQQRMTIWEVLCSGYSLDFWLQKIGFFILTQCLFCFMVVGSMAGRDATGKCVNVFPGTSSRSLSWIASVFPFGDYNEIGALNTSASGQQIRQTRMFALYCAP